MLPDMHFDIQIARHAALERLAHAGKSDHLAVIDARRDGYRNFFLLDQLGINDHFPFRPEDGFLEGKFDINRDVAAAAHPAAAENARENISKISGIKSGPLKPGEIETKPGWVKACPAEAARSRTGRTISVILLTFFLIREYGVGFVRLFELGFVSAGLVRMIDVGKFTKGFFYFVFGSISRNRKQ